MALGSYAMKFQTIWNYQKGHSWKYVPPLRKKAAPHLCQKKITRHTKKKKEKKTQITDLAEMSVKIISLFGSKGK